MLSTIFDLQNRIVCSIVLQKLKKVNRGIFILFVYNIHSNVCHIDWLYAFSYRLSKVNYQIRLKFNSSQTKPNNQLHNCYISRSQYECIVEFKFLMQKCTLLSFQINLVGRLSIYKCILPLEKSSVSCNFVILNLTFKYLSFLISMSCSI